MVEWNDCSDIRVFFCLEITNGKRLSGNDYFQCGFSLSISQISSHLGNDSQTWRRADIPVCRLAALPSAAFLRWKGFDAGDWKVASPEGWKACLTRQSVDDVSLIQNQRGAAPGLTVIVLPNGIKIPDVAGGSLRTARAPSLIATALTNVVIIKSA